MQRTIRKPGMTDLKIMRDKERALKASYSTHPAAKRAIMQALYGSTQGVPSEILTRINTPNVYRGAMMFTDRGDFTHLAGRGI